MNQMIMNVALWATVTITFAVAQQANNGNKIFELYMQAAQPFRNGSQLNSVAEEAEEACAADNYAFEFVYEHVLFAPDNVLDSIASVNTVEECVIPCRKSPKCRSFVFYDGGCIFFTVTEKQLSKSQFAVPETSGNYIYGQKFCSRKSFNCNKPAEINRFPNYRLGSALIKKSFVARSRFDCYDRCHTQKDFTCRAGNFNPLSNECQLSEMSRFTLGDMSSVKAKQDMIYFERNCVYEPHQKCHFRNVKGSLPTHVDAYYEIGNLDKCRDKCMEAAFNCRSFSILNEKLCLLTHDTEKTRLPYDKDLSYSIEDAVTFEQTGCFDVSLDCEKNDMTLRVNSSKLFNGKIYSKGSAESCVNDVTKTMSFDLKIFYDDINCGVQQISEGHFLADYVVQHFDKVITTNDVWISGSCQFDLQNQVVESEQGYAMVDSYALKNSEGAVFGKNEYKIDIQVEKPTIRFTVLHENLTELTETPSIGDPLAVYIEVSNRSSPYDIFVRDLVAFDAEGKDELPLIDERGCPLEPGIFNHVERVGFRPTKLAAAFSAFKFTGSDTVQFRTLVSLCIPHCEPVDCSVKGEFYGMETVQSYGRRRRRDLGTGDAKNDILISHTFKVADIKVIQDYQKQDVLEVDMDDRLEKIRYIVYNQEDNCSNATYIFWGAAFVVLEIIVTMFWTLFCYKR